MEGEEGREREGQGRTRKGRGKDKGKGGGILWDNSKRIVYKFFMGC